MAVPCVIPATAGAQAAPGSDPSFRPHHDYWLATRPASTAVGDVTGDGRNDVLVTTAHDSTAAYAFKLLLFPQQADGSLGAPLTMSTHASTGSGQMGIDVGDLNGDGSTDVAVATSAGVDLFYQSAGALSEAVLVPTEFPAQLVLIGDLEGDDDSDLVVDTGDFEGNAEVFVLRNDEGAFAKGATMTTTYQREIELGDVTGDGLLDVVGCDRDFANDCTAQTVNAFAQRPNGTFSTQTHDLVAFPFTRVGGLGIGDVTGDGRADVLASLVADQPASLLNVLPQREDGSLGEPLAYHVGNAVEAIGTADLNGDARMDVIMAHDCDAGVLVQQPDGTLAGGENLYRKGCSSHTQPRAFGTGDINSDGLRDLVYMNAPNKALTVLRQSPASDAVGISTSAGAVSYAGPVTVTARLGESLAAGEVSIYQSTIDSIEAVLATEYLEPGTAFSVTVNPTEDAYFYAESTSARSHRKLVLVATVINGSLSGYESRSGRYHVYEYDARCPLLRRHCPRFIARVVGASARGPLYFTWQAYRRGEWVTVREWQKMSSSEYEASVKLVYKRSGDAGIPMRVRARSDGDWEHIGSATRWKYFKIRR